MTDVTPPAAPIRLRFRIRYRKIGDLRLIGHLDLLRSFERLFRRAGCQLSMTQGFHPKPRVTFPLPLNVGMAGYDEVIELELAEHITPEQLRDRLLPQCPPGLEITSVVVRPPGAPKARVASFVCELPLSEQQAQTLAPRIAELLAQASLPVDRGNGKRVRDVRSYLEQLELVDGLLRMRIRVTPDGSARPSEILEALGIEPLEEALFTLRRTVVELEPDPTEPPA